MPRRAAARQEVQIIEPTSTNAVSDIEGSPEIAANYRALRTHWKWAAFSQFIYTFSQVLNMDDVSLSDIEDDLARGSSLFLPRVMTRLLLVLSYDRKVSLDNWQSALRKQYKRRDPDSNPIGFEREVHKSKYRYETLSNDEDASNGESGPAEADDGDANTSERPASEAKADPDELDAEDPQQAEELKDWLELSMLAKLDSMHQVTEWQFQNPGRLRTIMKSDDEDATWRIEPIGYDSKLNAYWLIGADRLWIQRSPPKPPRSSPAKPSLKRKRAIEERVTKSKQTVTKRPRVEPSRGRAAKAQAKIKLDAQAKELEELNRAAGLRSSSRRAASSSTAKRPLGTRLSARLRGSEDEWQQIPDEWLSENESDAGTSSSRGDAAKTGLESGGDSSSELTDLSEEEEAEDDLAGPAATVETEQTPPKVEEPLLPADFVEWETICITLYDWENIAERFQAGTHYTEKSLYKVLTKTIVPIITEELREAQQKRHLEEAVVHRKRSSRIANKEQEKAAAHAVTRQKVEAEENKTRAQRLEARLAKEEAAREKREAERLREAEEETTSEEEEEEKGNEVHDAKPDSPKQPAPSTLPTTRPTRQTAARNAAREPQPRQSQAAKYTNGHDSVGTHIQRGEDWTLNCEICRQSGFNLDEDQPLLSCGLCSEWQHIDCHDRADYQAGRPRRNWDKVDFVCRRCLAQRMTAKSAPHYPPYAAAPEASAYRPYGYTAEPAHHQRGGYAPTTANGGYHTSSAYPTSTYAGSSYPSSSLNYSTNNGAFINGHVPQQRQYSTGWSNQQQGYEQSNWNGYEYR